MYWFYSIPRFIHLATGVIEIVLPLFFSQDTEKGRYFNDIFPSCYLYWNLNVWINDLPYGIAIFQIMNIFKIAIAAFLYWNRHIIYLYE